MSGLNLIGWRFLLSIAISSISTLLGNCAKAQITSDRTLSVNSSITKKGEIFNITGGTQAGGNLFHSFQEFSVPTDNTAFFDNAADIQNIISRVTGNSISNIDGLIAANGTANLFLINPNGIVFGKNAELNIGGSFLASTASAIKFADNLEFSAINPQSAPLLSINVPIGLQYGANPGNILYQSQAFDSSGEIVGLEVQPGKTLALVGGDVVMEGGFLSAPSGRIELGSVAGKSFVSLTPSNTGYTLGYEGVENFKDIRLSQEAYIAADGDSGGSIQVQGANVVLTDGSGIEAITLGAGTGEGLTVNASGSLQLIGSSLNGQLPTGLSTDLGLGATGKAGNLIIITPVLLILDGAQVSTGTHGLGNGGNLIVKGSESVQVIGESTLGGYSSGLFTTSAGEGKAGDLSVSTRKLLVRSAEIQTASLGSGDAGSLSINAAESVQVIGTSANGKFPSSISAGTSGRGNAGKLEITTPVLFVDNGGQVTSGSFASGKAGDLIVNASESVKLSGGFTTADGRWGSSGLFSSASGTGEGEGEGGSLVVNTPVLLVDNGAVVSVSTDGSGKAGTLTINTSNSVQLIGRSPDSRYPSGLSGSTVGRGKGGDLTVNTPVLLVDDGAAVFAVSKGSGNAGTLTINASKLIQVIGRSADGKFSSSLSAGTFGTGKAGNLTIATQDFLISDDSEVSVSSTGIGASGDLNITANFIQLNNGNITAQTRSSNGGNLNLKIADLLLMRHGSKISTSAGTAEQGGDGGSININSKFIVAIPQENSDISANAFSGTGGNIKINTQGIFGIESRPKPTEKSDITASSELGVSGTISIGAPDTSSIQNSFTGLWPVIDTNALIANSCISRATKRQQNSFTITGSGALTTNRPAEGLVSTYTTGEVRGIETTSRPWKKGDPIIEPQGLYRLNNGQLLLSRECSNGT